MQVSFQKKINKICRFKNRVYEITLAYLDLAKWGNTYALTRSLESNHVPFLTKGLLDISQNADMIVSKPERLFENSSRLFSYIFVAQCAQMQKRGIDNVSAIFCFRIEQRRMSLQPIHMKGPISEESGKSSRKFSLEEQKEVGFFAGLISLVRKKVSRTRRTSTEITELIRHNEPMRA